MNTFEVPILAAATGVRLPEPVTFLASIRHSCPAPPLERLRFPCPHQREGEKLTHIVKCRQSPTTLGLELLEIEIDRQRESLPCVSNIRLIGH